MFHYRNFDLSSNVHVCHKCDNPRCCNPRHLYLGDASTNIKDAYDRKRRLSNAPIMKGTSNPRSKIDEKDVDFIVQSSGLLNNKETAEALNNVISHSMVSRIRLGKSWSSYTGIAQLREL